MVLPAPAFLFNIFCNIILSSINIFYKYNTCPVSDRFSTPRGAIICPGGEPMTVYADVLVIVNLYVDYILLRLVKGFLRLSPPGYRLVRGALAGGALSLVGLLPLPGWAGPMASGASALLTALAAFAPLGRKLMLRCWLSLWGASFLLAGAVLFVLQFVPAGHMAVVGGAVYFDLSLPVLFFTTCGAYIVFKLAEKLLPAGQSAPLVRLTVTNRGESRELWAKADTGCELREPFSGLPVIVSEREALSGLAPEEGGPMRLVPFGSLGGEGLLYAFRPDSVTGPGNAKLSCYIALTDLKLSSGQYAALYNPDMFQ